MAKLQSFATSVSHSNPCLVPQLTRGAASVRLFHAMAPNCWWSWGYYGTLARIRLVYGNQVDLRLYFSPVYTDQAHWLKHNGMDAARWGEWAKESAAIMKIPIFTDYAKVDWANDSSPAVFASAAAFRQGAPLGERFVRALLRRSIVEGRDAASAAEIAAAANEAGLDFARFEREQKDAPGLEKDLARMTEDVPGDVASGFYNIVLVDGSGRKMVLDHAFDPAPVEAAIEFLTGGRLLKNQPTDPVEYVRAAGPAPTLELARAFARPEADMRRELAGLREAGRLRRVTLAAGEHWEAA